MLYLGKLEELENRLYEKKPKLTRAEQRIIEMYTESKKCGYDYLCVDAISVGCLLSRYDRVNTEALQFQIDVIEELRKLGVRHVLYTREPDFVKDMYFFCYICGCKVNAFDPWIRHDEMCSSRERGVILDLNRNETEIITPQIPSRNEYYSNRGRGDATYLD